MGEQLTPEEDALHHILSCKDKPFLEERYIDSVKGRGVFTHKAIEPSSFVVEIRGKTFPCKDAKAKTKCGDTLKEFLFEFSWKGGRWCIDASKEDKTLGRLVNDDHVGPNCEVKKVEYDGQPHLCLFAVKEITPGEEITYNYGDSSYPWRPKFEDSDAASSSENSGSDDSDSGPSRHSSSNKKRRRGFSDKSRTGLDSSRTSKRKHKDDEAPLSSDEAEEDGDCVPVKAKQKPKDTNFTSLNYCYVCGKGFKAKISRHVLKHANEDPEVAKIAALPKKSLERRRLLDELRNKGNYKHNLAVLKNKSGQLKMRRRPLTQSKSPISDETYMHCLYCKGLFKRNEAWRHMMRCSSIRLTNFVKDDKTRFSGEVAPAVWKMLIAMQQDKIAKAIQSDFLLLQLASRLCERYGFNHEYVKQRLKVMGWLLIKLHEQDIFSFEDAIKPENFNKVVETVKSMAGFDEKTQSYNKPSLALKLGHLLKKIGDIVLECVDNNEQLIKDTKKFVELCAKEWSELASQTAITSLKGQKINSPSTIPFTQDVQVFYKYMERTSASAIKSLEAQGTPQAYTALCRVTLAQASILNKGAPEVSKMTVKTFQARNDSTRVLSKHFIKIHIPNKTTQNVAVLLTSNLVDAMKLLVSKREACGVHEDNPFLFAKPNSSSTSIFHGRNCVRGFSSLCRARKPEHLRSLHLHKHITRIFQVLNLENDELQHLAKLLSHDIPTDREYYRSPKAAVELAKIAKLIVAMEKGSLEIFKGNSLEEVEIEDQLEPDVELATPPDSDAEEENAGSDLSHQQSDAAKQQEVTEKKSSRLTPTQDALEHIKASKDKPFLEERFIDPIKGKGVFTREAIEPSAFVVEYRGKIISQTEASTEDLDDALKNYLFDFSWKGTGWRIDASEDDGSLGRLVNDDHKSPNCKMKKVVWEGKPHLCLFAMKKISPGEEITYNYGNSFYPWRSMKSNEATNTSEMDQKAAASSSEDERVEGSAEASSSDYSFSDDEYEPEPEPEPSSDDSYTSDTNCKSPKVKNSSDPESGEGESADASSIQQGEGKTDNNCDDFTSDEEPKVHSHDSKNYCYICKKPQTKIARHLSSHRHEVPEIAKVFALPLYSKERTEKLEKLRNRGNFQHNEEVLKTKRGQLKVGRKKHSKPFDSREFALCLYCKVMYSRREMWRHIRKCSSNSMNILTPGRRKILRLVDAVKSAYTTEISPEVKKLLEKLKNDKVASVVLSDYHILQLAQYFYNSSEGKDVKHDNFSHKVRLMGRLMLKLREKSISNYEEAVKPENFSKLAEAVREIGGYNEETKSVERPSVVYKLGYSLKKIGDINYAKALKEDADKQTMKKLETFVKLCATEWPSDIHRIKSNSTPTIPLIHDAQILFDCLEKTATSAVQSLTMYESPPVYNALLRVTMAQVAVFNRNMMELSKATVESFNEMAEAESQEDAAASQSQLDQILSKHTVKINVKTSSNKKVSIMMAPQQLDALKLLVSKRDACGVHQNNPFLFARPAALQMSYYRGFLSLNTFIARCGAKNQANLRAVHYHKHIARIFQILSLTNEDLDQLAKLLGRDIQTNREYYLTPEAAVDIAKISELLSALESGSLERYEGKSLEEIEIADELEPDMELDITKKRGAEEDNGDADAEEDNHDVEEDICDVEEDNCDAGEDICDAEENKRDSKQHKRDSKQHKRDSKQHKRDSKQHKRDSKQHKRDARKAAEEDSCDIEEDTYEAEEDSESENPSPLREASCSTSKGRKVSSFPDFPSPFSDSPPKKRGRGRPRKHESKSSSIPAFPFGLFSSERSLSSTKRASTFSQYCPSSSTSSTVKKRGRGRPRKDSTIKAHGLNDVKNDDVNTEKHDWSEDMPESFDVKTPEKTLSRRVEDATKMSFSDDDEDMNVDFDMDFDTDDDIRNEENVDNGDSDGSTARPLTPDIQDERKQDKKADSSSERYSPPPDLEEPMDTDTESHVEKEGLEEEGGHNKLMDVDSRSSSPTLTAEKKNRLFSLVASMKEVKILIPKLDIRKLKRPPRTSRLSSASNSQPVLDNKKQSPTPSTPVSSKNKPSDAKEILMTCSHCKKSMMKGQTAYQKKGFTDVFCSKNCLFEMFPINKTATKTCHYCYKAISQPQDLIMAAVDVKGTMKDFCSVTCLCSFKSNPVSSHTSQPVCSLCTKSCTTTCEFTQNGVVHKFCTVSCMEYFRKEKRDICEICSNTCTKKPLRLKLKDGTKIICSDRCLGEFKEDNETPQLCTMCQISLPVTEMAHYKDDDNMVELFCTRTCATSYRLGLELKPPGKETSEWLKERREAKQQKEKTTTENLKSSSGATVNKNDASSAAERETQTVIAESTAFCFLCQKEAPKGQKLYKAKSSPDVYCSASCLSKSHPSDDLGTKKCYNCEKEILRPHSVILTPIDESGTMKELCSNTCLSSVNSKRNMAFCRVCNRFTFCNLRQTLDGLKHRMCADTCFINYHKANKLTLFTCDVCSAFCLSKTLMLKKDDGSKSFCSDECLVKFKEDIKTPQLCAMCQTSHQVSDMVENINNDGWLDFFCSNRCIMMHKAQSLNVPESKTPPLDEEDIKELKPSLPNLILIKEEPVDDECKPNLSFSMSAESIKHEPKVVKEDLKIDSVFSMTEEDDPSPAPNEVNMDLPASCSNCRKALVDGATVYQRKGHADIFCSSPCLLKFYQAKQAKKTCHYCLQVISKPQNILRAPVDTKDTMKDFCSQTCLSSFNYKNITSTKIPIAPVASQSQCSMCSRYCISKHEVIRQDVVHEFCSDPCFLRFCNMNKLSICENCCSNCSTPIVLKVKDESKRLCSAECLHQFKQKIQTPQPCAMCHIPRLMSEMVENKNGEEELELFCTNSCVMASKIQAVNASGLPLACDHCGKTTVPACHLAMPDASIRNFCAVTCAMTFRETRYAVADQTQCDFLKPPEKLPCAQCRRILKTAPRVIQKKDKMNFVCSLDCSEDFRRVNNITGQCEYCKSERIISEVKRVDGKDCYFCSDGCRMLFHHELDEKWGKHCHSCAYCLTISKTVVTAQYKGVTEEFCSEDCNSKYKMLFCHVAKCDTCGREGKLKQSLPLVGEVKHFCDLKCLLHFCNKKVQIVNTVSSPPRTADTQVESSPVIANVISLAGALAKQSSVSTSPAQCGTQSDFPVSEIQTKVVGHASVQTVPIELKNKSVLCTPLVHNKGVSCKTQTVDTGAQTDKSGPTVVPIPVPVYVPVPMNMYSQLTPNPVGLPLPLPVPVFLPVTADSQEEREVTRERQEIQPAEEHNSNGSDDLHTNHQATFNNQDLPPPSTPSPPSPPPPALELTEDPQSSLSSAPSSPSAHQTMEKLHNDNKVQQLSTAAQATSRKHRKLESGSGVDAWKRWIQWKRSQTSLDLFSLFSPEPVTLKEEILHCSAPELSDALCCFITEVKQPDGESYSPDSLFYLCLSIQQYLFENDRMENIFSDLIYKKFSATFTKILRGFKPSLTTSGHIHSHVEEEFLWECKQLGAYSPIVILNTLLFFSCKYFGFTTVEQHRQLSFAHVRCCTRTDQNYTKTNVLRFYPPVSADERETDADGVPAEKRRKTESNDDILEMTENPENPLRCPVRLYEFYLSKCPESVRQRTDLFYLHPDRSCVPSSPLWFSSTPLDSSTMEAMLVRILAVQELQGEDRGGVDQQPSDDTPYLSGEEDSE